ncbi:MAG: hypothetical protein V5788_07390 [Shewanella sp.]
MQHNFRQFTHKIAIAMIAVVLLQFAGSNMGGHQLHPGTQYEEAANHPHLQFTAQVTMLKIEQCIAYSDSTHDNLSLDDIFFTGSDTTQLVVEPHNHQVSKTETKLFDLCLDCQCHGGHATVMTSDSTEPSVPLSDEFIAVVGTYLPPESLPNYRPPIV